MANLDPRVIRRATTAAQAILREVKPDLIVDGKPGTYTTNAYNTATSSIKSDVDSVVRMLGVPGGMLALNQEYKTTKTAAISSGDSKAIFDLQVVPAIIRGARRNGIDPYSAVAQVALESNWGKSTPRADDGSPSYNYAGIKWNAVKTAKKATARTGEVIAGKSVTINDAFAVFATPDEFATAYFNYLLNGPSSYRYKGLQQAKNATEYGSILQKGGYATDPDYARKFASVANAAQKRYA